MISEEYKAKSHRIAKLAKLRKNRRIAAYICMRKKKNALTRIVSSDKSATNTTPTPEYNNSDLIRQILTLFGELSQVCVIKREPSETWLRSEVGTRNGY